MAAAGATPSARPDRQVAFTFDDLPATNFVDAADARAITASLIATLRAHSIPATGFVVEGKLDTNPVDQEALTALLRDWLASGADLGNHTYSHMRLYDAKLEDFEADVLKGERVTTRLLGRRPRYFRHPTLNTGRDRATKEASERFLARQGYRIAPVTIDNDEWIYSRAYDRARRAGDTARMQRIGTDYLRYMDEMFGFFEGLSRQLFGREPAQVLLVHANALNAEYVDDLARRVADRGYRFVTLEAALEDPAYRSKDDYVGSIGPSWLERWAITRGSDPGLRPEVPAWVLAAAGYGTGTR